MRDELKDLNFFFNNYDLVLHVFILKSFHLQVGLYLAAGLYISGHVKVRVEDLTCR